MKKQQMLIVATMIGIAFVSYVEAKSTRVVGVLASVERSGPATLEISSKGAETQTVHTDAETAYMKWVTHKPWQQDTMSATSALVQGRCVSVDLRSDKSDIAKIVHISDEPAGSIFDPCRERR